MRKFVIRSTQKAFVAALGDRLRHYATGVHNFSSTVQSLGDSGRGSSSKSEIIISKVYQGGKTTETNDAKILTAYCQRRV